MRQESHETGLVRGGEPAGHARANTARQRARLRSDARHEGVLVVARAVGSDIGDEVGAVALDVLVANSLSLFVAAVDEHGDETPIVVRYPSRERLLEIDGDLFLAGRQETHERLTEEFALEQTGRLIANAFAQELAGFNLVRLAEV